MTNLVLFQIDHPSKLKLETDTSVLFAKYLARRGKDVWYYTPESLLFDGKVRCHAFKCTFNNLGDIQITEYKTIAIEKAQSVFIRHDPPYNMDYLTSCYMLKSLENKVNFYNKPSVIISYPEKIIPIYFQEYMPETLITASLEEAIRFKNKGKSVIKPLYGHAGEGVKFFKNDDDFINHQNIYGKYLVIQRYLPEIEQGDIRIIMSKDRIITSFIRVPPKGELRANVARGAVAFKYELTDKQRKICSIIGKFLARYDIILAGVDMIGNYITEINITSPTGVLLANKIYNRQFEEDILSSLVV